MKKPKNKIYFSKAPIKEAVCTFSFKEKLSPDERKKFVNLCSNDDFSEIQKQNLVNFLIKGLESEVITDVGYVLTSTNGDKKIQIQPNQIVIHKLGKYTKWSDFSVQVNVGLNYLNKLAESTITSISIKKVNSFSFNKEDNLSTYFSHLDDDEFFSTDDNLTVQTTKKIGQTTILSKLSIKELNKNKNVILENSVTTNLTQEKYKSTDKEKLFSILNKNNDDLYNAFFASIENPLFDKIK